MTTDATQADSATTSHSSAAENGYDGWTPWMVYDNPKVMSWPLFWTTIALLVAGAAAVAGGLIAETPLLAVVGVTGMVAGGLIILIRGYRSWYDVFAHVIGGLFYVLLSGGS